MMRSFTSLRPSWSSSRMRAASATSRRSSDSMPHGISKTVSSHVRIQPCSGLCSLVRSSLSISRSIAVCAPSRGARAPRGGCGSRRARPPRRLLAELLADGLELAAEQELALGLLHALLDVGLDPLAKREVGQGVTRPTEDEAQARLDVEGLEHLDLLRQGQVGRVARQVGDLARLGDLAQLRGHLASTPAEQDVLEHGPVLAGELAHRRGGRGLLDGLGLDPERLAGARHRGADRGARGLLGSRPAAVPPGSSPCSRISDDHADARVAAIDVRHEQQLSTGRAGGLGRRRAPRRTPAPS